MISLIFLFRFSLIFKLIFVLTVFYFSTIFLNFCCINFFSLCENFEAGMKIRKAEKREEFSLCSEKSLCSENSLHSDSRRNRQVKKKSLFLFLFFSKKNCFFINYFILFI